MPNYLAMSIGEPPWIWLVVVALAAMVLILLQSLCAILQILQGIKTWARAKGWTLVRVHRRSLLPPGRWTTGQGVQIFRVTLRDTAGITRGAWLICTDPNALEISDFEVIWDDRVSNQRVPVRDRPRIVCH